LFIESHFWWHRKETGPRTGRACGTSEGREVKVFSRMRAEILDGFLEARSMETAPPMDWP
jgi:hypothetical protein